MNFKHEVIKLMNLVENPSKIYLTRKNILDIEVKDVKPEIMEIIVGGDHKDLIGKKIFILEIVDIDADELKVE